MHILLLGARGYVGSTLLGLLLRHPHVQTITVSSDSATGTPVQAFSPSLDTSLLEKIDNQQRYVSTRDILGKTIDTTYSAVFSCLPHGILAQHIHTLYALSGTTNKAATSLPLQQLPDDKKSSQSTAATENSSHAKALIIDLSADFRLKEGELYAQYYKNKHPQPQLLRTAVYGLSEWYRTNIKNSASNSRHGNIMHTRTPIIANPGCYPTSALLPLLPVIRNCTVEGLIHIHSISGISGAGRTVTQNLLFCERQENISAYASGLQHRHVPEIQQCIQHMMADNETPCSFVFSPHLAPIIQGMFTTIAVPLSSKKESIRAKEALHAQYVGEHFVQVQEEHTAIMHGTADVRNTNTALIYAHCEDNSIILHCAIDNLWKGAAGQAVQNFNIYYGFDEREGLV